ncbi:MAG: response regulator [Myxococcota bacterium]
MLFVDDVAENRFLIGRLLAGRGHEVELASGGEEAIAKESEGTYDMILLDLGMPTVDGFEVARAIRKREKDQGLRKRPIVAISAFDVRDLGDQLKDAGIDSFMAKPLRMGPLMALCEAEVKNAGRPRTIPPNLDDYFVEVDPELIDIAPLFLESRKKDANRLPVLLATDDFAEIARLGHTIRGSSATFGFDALRDLGVELQAAAEAQDHERTASVVQRVTNYLRQVRFAAAP